MFFKLKIESILSKEESDSELLDDEDAVEKVIHTHSICYKYATIPCFI